MSVLQHTTYQVGLLQAKAYRALKTFMADQLKKHKLSLMEWAVIGYVYDNNSKGTRISDLAAALNVDVSLATNMVNDLQMRSFVKRIAHASDKRVRLVVISEKYEPKVQKIEQELRQAMKVWLKDINRINLLSYVSVLKQLAAKGTK